MFWIGLLELGAQFGEGGAAGLEILTMHMAGRRGTWWGCSPGFCSSQLPGRWIALHYFIKTEEKKMFNKTTEIELNRITIKQNFSMLST